SDWWKSNRTSLILMPNCIVEDTEIGELKRLSLSLVSTLQISNSILMDLHQLSNVFEDILN
ncbi:MAG: hypothetical protein ACK43J_07050, partial [Chitinophagaceae bacterium]